MTRVNNVKDYRRVSISNTRSVTRKVGKAKRLVGIDGLDQTQTQIQV
eukprot:CAMPEP_0116892376 /NCGR_PEP_ID=MMETSP0467-20121206/2617_1 /TAXON_ID=283647 /ORGANISM="Mesodinium pulex, Strain SPMC105" /LENGTH=46 /DNA_ID= /DNA_START= /DNA_END= /DNA_ORIENTATION=